MDILMILFVMRVWAHEEWKIFAIDSIIIEALVNMVRALFELTLYSIRLFANNRTNNKKLRTLAQAVDLAAE